MGKHRFELCLARHPLPPAEQSRPVPRIGFAVPRDLVSKLPDRLAALQIEVAPVPLPEGLGISDCLRLRDPDGNIVELAAWDGQASGDAHAASGAVPVTDVCHVALEVSDLSVAEKFYTEALGLTLLHRDQGELGNGRTILKNGLGQVLFLEAVDQLSERSLFCGPDASTAPNVGHGRPHAGAHIAVSVADDDAYRETEAILRAWNVTTRMATLPQGRTPDRRTQRVLLRSVRQSASTDRRQPLIESRTTFRMKWGLLAVASVGAGFLAQAGHVPAAWLIGPMVVAIVAAITGFGRTLPRWTLAAPQGVIAVTIAQGLHVAGPRRSCARPGCRSSSWS